MSVVPSSTLPKCTRTAVIDLLFMRKYQLTHAQMLVMYYLLMLKNWVKFVDDEHYVILSKKIEDDLGLHQKTVEASITQLKKLNLIHTKRSIVKEWNNKRTYRAIAISSLGKEYNLSYYKEDLYQNAVELEKENELYRVENDKVHSENMELESRNKNLELRDKILTLQIEGDEAVHQASLQALEKVKVIEDKYKDLEIENRVLKERIEIQEKAPQTHEEEKENDKNMEKFIDKTIRKYARSGKALCNAVQNSDNWSVKTNFYINSFSRIGIYLPNGKPSQLSDPKQIDNFWKWLFYHQHRVGNLLKIKKVANISTLSPFKNASITINYKSYKIHDLKAVIGGVKVTLLDENSEPLIMSNGYGSKVVDVRKCEEFFELCLDRERKIYDNFLKD